MTYAKQIVQAAMLATMRQLGVLDEEMPDVSGTIDIDAIIASVPKPEPFGYFRCDPAFGWEDCAEDAECAIALYEEPASAYLTDDKIKEIADHEMTGFLYLAVDGKIYRDSDQRDLTVEVIGFARAIERKVKVAQ